MSLRCRCFVAGLVCSIFAGVGCSESKDEIPPSTKTVGSEGGTVATGGASIAIPAGALSSEVAITVGPAAGTATIEGAVVVGPFIEIGPSGTVFANNATVTVPFSTSSIPSGADAAQVQVYTAANLASELTPLTTTVNAAAETASAEVDHLSIFVAAIPSEKTSPVGIPPCPAHVDDCGCESYYATRPLNISGTANLGRPIRAICWEPTELRVTSYVPSGSADPFAEPAEIYDTRFDLTTLVVKDESLFTGSIYSAELCQPDQSQPFLSRAIGAYQASARFVEHKDAISGQSLWFEALLTVSGPQGSIEYSFNKHLNETAPYTDDYFLYDDENSLSGRVLPDGSASFYLHIFHEGHVDAIHVDDLKATLTNPGSHVGDDGLGIPSARDRIELWGDPASRSNGGYAFDSLVVTEDPLDDRADVLLVFSPGPSGLYALRTDRDPPGTWTTTMLPDLGLDEFWSQMGWHNGGLFKGSLFLQSNVASFTNSVVLQLDPAKVEVINSWEIGCLQAPSIEGFRVLESGALLRFGWSPIDEKTYAMLVRDGDIEGIAQVPFLSVRPTQVLSPDQRMLYVAQHETGELNAIEIPAN